MLCKTCGYPLDDVRNEPACPECGTPLAASLPAARIGSPWQQRPSIGSWRSTLIALARWRELFDVIRIGRHEADWLLRINLLIAAFLLAAAFAEDRIDEVFLHQRASLAGLLGAMLVLTPAWYAALRGLTAIERAGLRFFGNKRGGRITPGIARAVTSHASYGWVLAGLLAMLGAFLGHGVLRPWYASLGAGWVLKAIPPHLAFGFVGLFCGLLVFETLSYLGAMRCRFANPARPADETVNETGRNAEPSVDDDAEPAQRAAAGRAPVDVPAQADAPDQARE